MIKEEYMRRAIELAKRATGFTNPNPLVGVVIVKEDRIIGEGYHEKCGQLHAERNAFASLKESAEGATLYVTLEPCCHYGKTPPCTERSQSSCGRKGRTLFKRAWDRGHRGLSERRVRQN